MKMGFEKHKQKHLEESREELQTKPKELGSVDVASSGNIQERNNIPFFESLGAKQDMYDSREFQKALDDLFAAQDEQVKVSVDKKVLEATKDLPVYEKKLEDELSEKSSLEGMRYLDAEIQRFLALQNATEELYSRVLEQRLEYRDTDDEEINNTIKDRMDRRIAFAQKNQKNASEAIEFLEGKRGEWLVKSLQEGTIQEEGENYPLN